MATASVSERTFEEIEVGEEIPAFDVALTPQRMVMEVGVSQDYAPIHHDREIAQELGAPDMFVNTLFLQGVYEAAVREWAGLAMKLVSMQFRMNTFNCAGEMLTTAGRVTDKKEEDGRKLVEIEMWTETPDNGKTTNGKIVAAF